MYLQSLSNTLIFYCTFKNVLTFTLFTSSFISFSKYTRQHSHLDPYIITPTLAIQSLLQIVVTQIICASWWVNSVPITKWNAITVITIDNMFLIVPIASADYQRQQSRNTNQRRRLSDCQIQQRNLKIFTIMTP